MNKIVTIAALFIALTATVSFSQGNTSKVKKLYTKEEAEKALEQIKPAENLYNNVTETMYKNIVNNTAKIECKDEVNEELSKKAMNVPGRGPVVISSKPMNVMIDECVRKKTPGLWNKREELVNKQKKILSDNIAEVEKMLTIEGCKKTAEEDKDCTDDLIVKFDRFGTCTCETY